MDEAFYSSKFNHVVHYVKLDLAVVINDGTFTFLAGSVKVWLHIQYHMVTICYHVIPYGYHLLTCYTIWLPFVNMLYHI